MVLLGYFTLNIIIGHHLVIKIRYVYQRGNTCYWQRKVPLDVADRYPSGGPLKVNLESLDPVVIASKVAKLNRQHDALWAAMRKDRALTPLSAKDEAKKLLKSFGVDAATVRHTSPATLDSFLNHLEGKRESYAESQPVPEEAYRDTPPDAFLSKPELEALSLIHGADKFLMSDALELYLDENSKNGQVGFAKLESYTRRAWKKLTNILGDKVFTEVTRDDARSFRDSLLGEMKTASVRRNLNVIVAVFGAAIAEKPVPNHPNVWESIKIKAEGVDSEERVSLTTAHMATIRDRCKAADDDLRWLLSIQLDGGTRIAEVAGLALEDILITGEEVPYLNIKAHPWRPLDKSDGSTRKIPLIGHALWAAKRVLETAEKGQLYAFPRYIRDGQCIAGNASATLNKWMRTAGVDRTTHCFRHTMRDRLRSVDAPKDIQDAVGGWGKTSIGETYGQGYMLATLQAWMQKTLPVVASS